MKRKIVGIFFSTLFIGSCILLSGTITNNKNTDLDLIKSSNKIEMTPFWQQEHTVSIWMNQVYVKESGDREAYEPGEYFFKIFAFPQMWHWTTDIYEVGDEHPEDPYSFGKLASFQIKFTPQILILLAIEEDKKEDLNTNEFMDWKVYTFKPPRGDYPSNDPYQTEKMTWENQYFKAIWTISFHY